MNKLLSSCLVALALVSCDPCENAVCLHGGTCVDGECECAFLYYGENCEEKHDDTSTVMFWCTPYVEDSWDNSGVGFVWAYANDEFLGETIVWNVASGYDEPPCGNGFATYTVEWTENMTHPHSFYWEVVSPNTGAVLASGNTSVSYDQCKAVQVY